MPTEIDGLLWMLGRVLLGGLFVLGGIKHYFIMPAVLEMMTARGVPFPKLVLITGSIFQLACGSLFVLGIYTSLAATGLIIFTIAASIMLLNFWDLEPGPAREGLMNAFYTNIALIGGLLIAAGYSI
jgi:putative oxidoreductase